MGKINCTKCKSKDVNEITDEIDISDFDKNVDRGYFCNTCRTYFFKIRSVENLWDYKVDDEKIKRSNKRGFGRRGI